MEYGFLSLIPPLLSIILALVTKNVFISLFLGIFTGSLVLNAFAPLAGFNAALYSIVDSMSQGNTIIIASCLIVGAVIHLMERSGGIEGFVNVVVKKLGLIKTKRGANLFTWLLGLAVFTSGSAGTMAAGDRIKDILIFDTKIFLNKSCTCRGMDDIFLCKHAVLLCLSFHRSVSFLLPLFK